MLSYVCIYRIYRIIGGDWPALFVLPLCVDKNKPLIEQRHAREHRLRNRVNGIMLLLRTAANWTPRSRTHERQQNDTRTLKDWHTVQALIAQTMQCTGATTGYYYSLEVGMYTYVCIECNMRLASLYSFMLSGDF